MLRLLRHGAGRWKRDRGKKTASDLAISAGHLHIAGIVSADPKKLDLMEIAAAVCWGWFACVCVITLYCDAICSGVSVVTTLIIRV